MHRLSKPLINDSIELRFTDPPRDPRIRPKLLRVLLLYTQINIIIRLAGGEGRKGLTASILSTVPICCNLINFSLAPPKLVCVDR